MMPSEFTVSLSGSGSTDSSSSSSVGDANKGKGYLARAAGKAKDLFKAIKNAPTAYKENVQSQAAKYPLATFLKGGVHLAVGGGLMALGGSVITLGAAGGGVLTATGVAAPAGPITIGVGLAWVE